MKKILLTVITVLTLSVQAFPAINGLPFTDDQYAHAFGSAYVSKLCKSNGMGFWETTGIILALGTLKELYDMKSTGFNTDDILVNLSGVGICYTVDFVFDL